MATLLGNLARNLLDIVYYQSCAACGIKGEIICKTCQDSFRIIDHNSVCPVCGNDVGRRIICGDCLTNKRGFSEGYFGFVYENRLRDAVHTFKFNGRPEVGRYLVSLLKDSIIMLRERVDCIVPIPVTEKRLRERGYNQSFIISEEISNIIGRPIFHSVLFKIKETKDQYSLSKDERRKNIRGAFAVKSGSHIKGKKVLIVDDLFTTGYTAHEASWTISKAMPESIIFFALARTR
ncbi:MAG TPA: ComF family protein [Syntrophorhabdaceae bacterium]|nr:ComF family protein [Syntrophorhabdaceae bacterium]HPC66504.1 ComF family protein [Syntrophorhabdaceae bacterium]HQE79735.1 ComF family protein [Syntrophorhabdaceae bacterium]HQK46079.1 ComF family protein [Syntrophorhabdaceae bacterium]HRV22404.1 ComF family protein [Syntrophorhabdaceae bacterium]